MECPSHGSSLEEASVILMRLADMALAEHRTSSSSSSLSDTGAEIARLRLQLERLQREHRRLVRENQRLKRRHEERAVCDLFHHLTLVDHSPEPPNKRVLVDALASTTSTAPGTVMGEHRDGRRCRKQR
ncbi:hypothetical protein QOT17_019422 [Balamuthia mandrillaris]